MIRFGKCKANKLYCFPDDQQQDDDLSDCDSLVNVTSYNLHAQNHQGGYANAEDIEESEKLTDATQPEFVRQINKKLIEHQKQALEFEDSFDPGMHIRTEGNQDDQDYSHQKVVKQHNYIKPQGTAVNFHSS